MSNEADLIACPGGCGLQLPIDAADEQVAHLSEHHPDVVVARLRAAGMQQQADTFEQGHPAP